MKVLLATVTIALMVLGTLASRSCAQTDYSVFPQEKIIYTIKKFGMSAGQATLVYHGLIEEQGKALIKIVFTSDGFNFYDQEIIYADPGTLLPVRVERDLNIFGNKERIVENYYPQDHKVDIIKYKEEKVVDTVTFHNDQPIDNLYCFIYRYRSGGVFESGERFKMNLPTKTVALEIVKKTTITVAREKREAWLMQSDPKEYNVWFGADEQHTPLRIEGAAGLAKTVMIFEKHEIGKIQ
ncbi:MAG TPA: hypothetical protein VLJ10_02645 [Candidatus Bathyarchaeia archaeon]|nr:hypothetical protein [Candidatus Bathyarchaeia archaeon]